MDKIKTVKIKNPDGSVSEETYTISVDAKDVDMKNGKDLQDTIGDINVDRDGSIAEQLGKYKNYDSDIETLYADVDSLEAKDTDLENDIIDLQVEMDHRTKYYEKELYLYCSQLGFSGNSTENFNILKTTLALNKKITLIVDNSYSINNTESINLMHDLTIKGINNGTLTILNTGYLFILQESNLNISFENCSFIANSNETNVYLLDSKNEYTKKIDKISCSCCQFDNVGLIRHSTSPEDYTLQMLNYGYNNIIINNNIFTNNKSIPIVIQNCPCELFLTNNIIKNIHVRFSVFAITNDNQYAENFRKTMNLVIKNNSLINDEDFYTEVRQQQYYGFTMTKCGKIIATNNYIENIVINTEYASNNEPVEVFGMYLLCDDLFFEGNTFKNIYNFSYTGRKMDGGSKIETISLFPNIKAYSGHKVIINNKFELEETWLSYWATYFEKSLNELVALPIMNIYHNDMDIVIKNNVINSYFGYFSYKNYSYDVKNFIMDNNNFNITRLTGPTNSYLLRMTNNNANKIFCSISNNNFNFKKCEILFNIISLPSDQEQTFDIININNNIFTIEDSIAEPTFITALSQNNVENLNIINNNITIMTQTSRRDNYLVRIMNYENFNFMNNNINGNFISSLGFIGLGTGKINIKNNYNIKNIRTLNTENRLYFILPSYLEKDVNNSKYIIKISKYGKNIEYIGEAYFKLEKNNNTNNLILLNSSGEEISLDIDNMSGARLYDKNNLTMMRCDTSSIVSNYPACIYFSNDILDTNEEEIVINVELFSFK